MKLDRYPLLMPHDFDNVIIHEDNVFKMEYIEILSKNVIYDNYTLDNLCERLIELMGKFEFGMNYLNAMLSEYENSIKDDEDNMVFRPNHRMNRIKDILLRARYQKIFSDNTAYNYNPARLIYLYDHEMTGFIDSLVYDTDPSTRKGIVNMNYLPHKCTEDANYTYLFDSAMVNKEYGINLVKEENEGEMELYTVCNKLTTDRWISLPGEEGKFEFQEEEVAK